jgi:hypothetical protein
MKSTLAALALSAGLFFSAIIGADILSTDAFLWAAARSHAYGLLVFVALELVLIVAIADKVRYAGTSFLVRHIATLIVVLAVAQLLAMVGDLEGLQPPTGMPASIFEKYLLSDQLYVGLLVLQPVVAGLGVWFRRENWYPRSDAS